MPVSDVLKSFRKDGYSPDKGAPEEKEPDSPRLIKLTDEEAKSLAQGSPGGEVTVQVSGRLEGNQLTVMSVQGTGGGMPDENEMAAQVMGKPPMMQSQTMPSPS